MLNRPADEAHHRKPVVLLVEDNVAMRALIRSLLEDVAPMIHECEDGQKAVAAYAAIRPDCVLMDIELGGLDGIAATRAICQVDPGAHVIIVTAHGSDPYRRAAEEAGAKGFVLKENLLDLPTLLASTPLQPGLPLSPDSPAEGR